MRSAIENALEELKHSPQSHQHVRYLSDTLSIEERRRQKFYEEIDDSVKAEFINGQIIMHSPARALHLDVTLFTVILLSQYVIQQNSGWVCTEKCLIRCQRNDYEPDVCFFGAAKAAAIQPEQNLFPPPDLIVEVLSPSTARNDRELKFRDYALHGVGEYWIIDADARVIEQYTLAPGANDYSLLARIDARGRIASVAVTGFEAPAAALFDARENQRALLALLQSGAKV